MMKYMIFALLMMVMACSADVPTEVIANSKTVYIDVRTDKEFQGGHIEQAINIPYDQIAERISEVTTDHDQPIVVYCRSGGRAGVAEKTLKKMGYTQVVNGGGYRQLKEQLKSAASGNQ